MPPSNTTPTTALDIGTLTGYTPYTHTEDAFNGATTDDLWFLYTPVEGDTGLEVYGYGLGAGGAGSYLPHLTIYTGPATAPVQLSNSHDSQGRPVQQDIQTYRAVGQPILFKFAQQGGLGDPNPSTLTLRIARWQNESLIHGDLFINDSSPDFPGIAMARATAIPSRYQLAYPAGEGQQTLRNGIVAVIGAFAPIQGIVLYNVAADGLTVRVTPTMPDTHYTNSLSTNQIDTFWALRRFGVGHVFAVSIDQNGVVGTPLDLGSANFDDVVPQADNTAVYGEQAGVGIVKITNPGGIVSTIITPDAGFTVMNNLLMLTDDTLLVGYEKAATLNYVKQYDLTGTLLSTTTLTGVVGTVVERIFADPQDPLYFWTWRQTSTLNFFERWAVGASAFTEQVSRMKFIESVSQTALVTGDTVYSGADFSCVPIVLRLSDVPTTTFTIRRQRRWLLPSSDADNRMTIPTLELLMRTGIGLLPDAAGSSTPLGVDPEVRLRISKDGGKTWGPERARSAGLRGEFKDRVRWTRATGNYRNGVGEVTVDAPVDWQWLAMLGDPTEGSS